MYKKEFFDLLISDYETALQYVITNKIVELDFSSLEVTDDHAFIIADLLAQVPIKILYLEHNDNIGVKGWQSIGSALKECNTLEELYLSHSSLNDIGIKYILNGLRNSTNIHILTLDDNNLTTIGAEIIGLYLGTNPPLLELNLGQNKIGLHGLTYICKGLKKNNTLLELFLHDNLIDDEGAVLILETLDHHVTLIDLDLSDNDISEKLLYKIEDRIVIYRHNWKINNKTLISILNEY